MSSTRQHLILIPGLLCDERLWAHQTRHLGECAEMTVADTLQDDSVGAMAERLLAAAPNRFALAGLSMGGYVALEVMRRAPQRVTKLALLDTSARADTEDQTSRRRGLIELARKGRFKGVTPRLLPLLIHADRMQDVELTQTVMDMAAAVGQEAFVRQQTAILTRPDSRDSLSRITVPTLVLVGREDALTPPELAGEMAEGISDARLAIIEECGHLSTLERPQATTALLRDWLVYGR